MLGAPRGRRLLGVNWGPIVSAQRSVDQARMSWQDAMRLRDRLIRDAVRSESATEREVAARLRLSTGRVHNIVAVQGALHTPMESSRTQRQRRPAAGS